MKVIDFEEIKKHPTFFLLEDHKKHIRFRIYDGNAPKKGSVISVNGVLYECIYHEYVYTEHYRDLYAVITTLQIIEL